MLRSLKQLPPFPAVAAKLLTLVSGGSPSFRDVADLIRSDPALAAEVLRLANSPLVGLRWEVTNVLQALSLLGADRLNALVTTVAMIRFTQGAPRIQAYTASWRHHVATALIAEQLADQDSGEREAAYTAGLLHDVGRLALLRLSAKEYSVLLETVPHSGMLDRERIQFGLDHCAAGEYLAREWHLPSYLIQAAAEHHHPAASSLRTTALVAVACRLASTVGFRATQHDDGPDARVVADGLNIPFPSTWPSEESTAHWAERINALEHGVSVTR